MNSRVREDEKHELIIRKLLKNTENKRCINCGSLGPQYVCTNFSIFVCTYCSGAHREFSHRIKSISMAKFTRGEVANLQSGGNGRAREIYFKELDLFRNPLPDSSDSIKLRSFINFVYVERRYTGEQPAPLKIQELDRDDYESRRLEIRKPSLQSPSREDQKYDRHNNERFSDRARKSDVEGYHNEKRSPKRFESYQPPCRSLDDREGQLDEKENPEATRDKVKSPVRPFTFRSGEDDGSPIRSVKEILGDDAPSLRIDLNGPSVPGTIFAQIGLWKDGRTQSLNHLGNEESSAPVRIVQHDSSENLISLIDFSADPEPVVAPGTAADLFAPSPATFPDPFAPTSTSAPAPPSAKACVLDLFGSDRLAVAADAKLVADPFAPVPTFKRASDPFGFGGQGSGGTSKNSSWATFDSTVNPVPPEGNQKENTARTSVPTQFSGLAAWDTSSTTGSSGWSAFGLQTPATTPVSIPGTAPASLAASSCQSAIQVQMGFLPQLTAPDMLQAPSASGRVRRELPQEFFAQFGVLGIDARQDLASSMGIGHIGAPLIPQRGQQGAAQPSRTRNPFDNDDPPPAPFNTGSMQAALSQVGNPLSDVASQWSQLIPELQLPATPAGAVGYTMQITSNMHQRNGQPGGFDHIQGFNRGSLYGGTPFYSQTAGSNPFR